MQELKTQELDILAKLIQNRFHKLNLDPWADLEEGKALIAIARANGLNEIADELQQDFDYETKH